MEAPIIFTVRETKGGGERLGHKKPIIGTTQQELNSQGISLWGCRVPEVYCFQKCLEMEDSFSVMEMHPETMRGEENIIDSLLFSPSVTSKCLPLTESSR